MCDLCRLLICPYCIRSVIPKYGCIVTFPFTCTYLIWQWFFEPFINNIYSCMKFSLKLSNLSCNHLRGPSVSNLAQNLFFNALKPLIFDPLPIPKIKSASPALPVLELSNIE